MNPDKQNVDHLSYRKLLIKEIIMFHAFGGQSQSTGPRNLAFAKTHVFGAPRVVYLCVSMSALKFITPKETLKCHYMRIPVIHC